MTFSISLGVPVAGVAVDGGMLIGVARVLGTVALAAVLFRQQLLRLIATRPGAVDVVMRAIQVVAGLVLVAVARNAILGGGT